MPRFSSSYGGFVAGMQTDCDSYFDQPCDDEEDEDDDDEYDRPSYDRYEDEPSEEDEENKYKPRRRVKTRATRKCLRIFVEEH